MTTQFTKNDEVREVVKVTEKFVFAKKVDPTTGKSGKGRPGKFDRAEIETLLGVTLELTPEVEKAAPVDENTTAEQTFEQVTENVVPDLSKSDKLSVPALLGAALSGLWAFIAR